MATFGIFLMFSIPIATLCFNLYTVDENTILVLQLGGITKLFNKNLIIFKKKNKKKQEKNKKKTNKNKQKQKKNKKKKKKKIFY